MDWYLVFGICFGFCMYLVEEEEEEEKEEKEENGNEIRVLLTFSFLFLEGDVSPCCPFGCGKDPPQRESR
jgi:hypothetical protein